MNFKELYNEAIDALIDGFERPCELVFPSTKFEPCDCELDNKGNRGPNPFVTGGHGKHTGTCSKCQGSKKRPIKNSIIENLVVIWNPKTFIALGLGDMLTSANGEVQTLCNINKIDKIRNVEYIILNTEIQALGDYRYIRDGEPTPIGLGQDRYMLVNWKKS